MAPGDEKKKKKRRRRKKKMDDDDFMIESANVAKKLHEKYGSKKGPKDGDVIKTPRIMSGKLVHPTKYLTLMERAERSQWNRLSVPVDPPEKLLPNTRWICALCKKYSCSGDTGDLFGPYYIELDLSSSYFPDFLFPEGTQRPTDNDDENPPSIDVYLHGRCALWSEDLFFLGGKFPMLKEKLYQFWQTTCSSCGKSGASIKSEEEDSFVHFHCLKDHS